MADPGDDTSAFRVDRRQAEPSVPQSATLQVTAVTGDVCVVSRLGLVPAGSLDFPFGFRLSVSTEQAYLICDLWD